MAPGGTLARSSTDQSRIGAALGVRTDQDALAVLERVPLQPLTAFVAEHVQPDGGLVVPPGPVLEHVNASMRELHVAYAENVIGINRAEQQTARPAFFSWRAEDPLPVNILGEIDQLVDDRLERLTRSRTGQSGNGELCLFAWLDRCGSNWPEGRFPLCHLA